MELTKPFCRRLRNEGTHHRLRESPVEPEIDLRNARGSREAALVGRIVDAECAEILKRPLVAPHHPFSSHETGMCRVTRLLFEDRFVKTWRQDVDQVDVVGEFTVLLARYLARYEHAEVTDRIVNRVHDGLPVLADIIDVLVEIENPSQGPLRRRDVVALGTKHHDRRLNVAQVDSGSVRSLDHAGCELVSYEQLVDDRLDFICV